MGRIGKGLRSAVDLQRLMMMMMMMMMMGRDQELINEKNYYKIIRMKKNNCITNSRE